MVVNLDCNLFSSYPTFTSKYCFAILHSYEALPGFYGVLTCSTYSIHGCLPQIANL